METKKYKLLLIEDNPGCATIVQKRLSMSTRPSFEIQHASTLHSAFDCLARGEIDIVLLDLNLPDSRGIATFLTVHAQAPAVPIVVLTGLDDETLGLEAVRKGAQEYLVKGKHEVKSLSQVLCYAIERHRQQEELRSKSFIDELTGLYNRRGFFVLVEQQLKLAIRNKKGCVLLFFDLDHLKQINDTHGHAEGDKALFQVGETLRATFRKSDIMARIGGDEFAVLAIEANAGSPHLLLARLQDKLKDCNDQKNLSFEISLSSGAAIFDPHAPCSFEQLMEDADRVMYKDKRHREVSTSQGARRKRILIIDDDPSIQKMLRARMANSGYETFFAQGGKEGLEDARRWGPNLIILDLMLPDFSGEEICKMIREDRDEEFASTPIIMLTGKTTDVDRIIGRVVGADAYITKPFPADQLLKEIERLASAEEVSQFRNKDRD